MTRTRTTKQKRIIDEEIRTFRTFFSVEDAYERVRKRDDGIGIATVYRYLREIESEEGLNVYTCNRRRVYSFNRDSHCHFICTVCGKAFHFEMGKLDDLKDNVRGKISHFQIDVHGVCESCLESGSE